MIKDNIGFIVGGFPIAIFIGFLILRIWKNKQYKDPLTQFMLRPPGETLRLRCQKLDEKMSFQMVWLFAAAAFAGISASTLYRFPLIAAVFVGATYVVIIVLGRMVYQTLLEYRRCHLGFTGERAIGEELNQLLAEGWKVFHDVTFDENPGQKPFNIDHIVVGQGGVFAIETKTRRKRHHSPNKIIYDGEALIIDSYRDEKPVCQARKNALHLERWLGGIDYTGTVQGVIAIPGWSITRKSPNSPKVLSGREVAKTISYYSKYQIIDPAMVKSICSKLDDKCRNVGL